MAQSKALTNGEFELLPEDENVSYLAEYVAGYSEEDFGELGIVPNSPTEAKPGSEDKVMMLAARYAAGLPLWHDSDRYDHGPDGAQLGEDGEELYEEDE